VAPYIETRMRSAGYTGAAPVFTPQAYAKIAELSGGIPRDINNICFHALSLGCAQGLRRIHLDVLEEVATDLNWGSFSKSGATPERSVVASGSVANRVERPAPHSFARRVASPYRTAMPPHIGHARPVPAELRATPTTARVATAPAPRPAAHPLTAAEPRSTPEQRPATASSAPPAAATHLPTAAPSGAIAQAAMPAKTPPAPPKPSARQLVPPLAAQPSPQHTYGIPLLVFLIILIAGLAWILWNNPAILSLLHGSNARAEAPASAQLIDGNTNQTLLLHSSVAAHSAYSDTAKGSDDDDTEDDVRWIKPLAKRNARHSNK